MPSGLPVSWLAWPTAPSYPLPLHARGDRVYVGLANQMLILERARKPVWVEFGQFIVALIGSAPATRPRIAATFERGGAVYWDEFDGGSIQPFATQLVSPVASFNRGGYLIAASEEGCEVYRTQGRRLQLEAEFNGSGSRPLAVLSAPRNDQFGIIWEKGEIDVYELP